MDASGSAFKILTGMPAGKRPLGRPRRRWEENIRIYLKERITANKNLKPGSVKQTMLKIKI